MLSGLRTHDPAGPPCASPDAWRKRQQHAPPRSSRLPQLWVQTQGVLLRIKPTAGVPEQLAQSRCAPRDATPTASSARMSSNMHFKAGLTVHLAPSPPTPEGAAGPAAAPHPEGVGPGWAAALSAWQQPHGTATAGRVQPDRSSHLAARHTQSEPWYADCKGLAQAWCLTQDLGTMCELATNSVLQKLLGKPPELLGSS